MYNGTEGLMSEKTILSQCETRSRSMAYLNDVESKPLMIRNNSDTKRSQGLDVESIWTYRPIHALAQHPKQQKPIKARIFTLRNC
jgi:hypothetical protein